MEDWLSDEIRGRSAAFWARGIQGGWPIDAQGYTFLAKAILVTGPALFGKDWTGREPIEWFLPNLDGSRPYHSQGFDAVYALSLIKKHRPEIDAGLPLKMSDWQMAFEIYEQFVAEIRATHTQRMAVIHRRMTEALANGELISATRQDGVFVEIPANHWIDESIAYARFLESQMDPRRPFIQNWPSIYDVALGTGPVTLIPGNEWIFLTKLNLEKWLGRIALAPSAPRRETKGYTQDKVDNEFKKLYASIKAGQIERPRDRQAAVALIIAALPGLPIEMAKRRFAKTRPDWWKSGPRTKTTVF